jgi:hypothetical protein
MEDPNVSTLASPPPTTPQAESASLSFLEKINNRSPEAELPPDEGALQFVPAFEESSKGSTPGASWSDDEDQRLLRDEKKDASEPRGSGGTSPGFTHRARQWKRTQSARREARSTVETKPSNTRIARLASLFSSRAVVRPNPDPATTPQKQQQQQPVRPRQPSSPVPSSSSSGYVGWPGTVDKGGRTVSLPSSYDDSSSAGPPRASPVSAGSSTPRSTTPRRETRREEAQASPKRSMSAVQYELARQQQPPLKPEVEPDFWHHFDAKLEWNDAPSSPSTNSKTSSAYFQPKDMRQLAYPDLEETPQPEQRSSYGLSKNAAASILRQSPLATRVEPPTRLHASARVSPTARLSPPSRPSPPVRAEIPTRSRPQSRVEPPTAERLAVRDHYTPPHRSFSGAKGYSGFLQKTQEVPSLMDDVNSEASSKATSVYSVKPSGDDQSDIFDGLSVSDVFDGVSSPRKSPSKQRKYPERINEEEEEDFKMVLLGGGLTAIQSSVYGFSNRQTASDYDENLTNSDVDPQGFAQTPNLKAMLTAGTSGDSALSGIHGNFGNKPASQDNDEGGDSDQSGSSIFTDPYVNSVVNMDGDLAEYYIDQSEMKKVLRKFRELSERAHVDMSLTELEKAEDENKAFALFEMRSRIMEKDIERGLERRGGTVAVDDLVTTAYHRTAHRIRDAVIVSKAWRDGANPQDVVNTAILTRRAERAYFVKRPLMWQEQASRFSGYSTPRYYWEAVKWVDDTDFMLNYCPSLGPKNLRGFDMFTVGDCQSILLKLTNERCIELRGELNEATKHQIEAEELMKAEGDADDGMMTEAEMTYLTSMEEVKTISKQLVGAEQSFALVRDRIEKLVARYQSLLLKIETAESLTGASSIVTYSSSYYSDHDSAYWDEEEERETAIWARRARRAEIKAEVAAREALLAKQEAQMVREEKELELNSLRLKLTELQSESSHVISERERLLVNRIAPQPQATDDRLKNGAGSSQLLNKQKLDGVKQRFRDRMAARKKTSEEPAAAAPQNAPQNRQHQSNRESLQASFVRTAGEEMYQHLDFYERSLKAVDETREN